MAVYGKDAKRHLYDWVNATPVNMTQRAVLKAIAEFADPSGETFREQDEIAERVACSTKTVWRALKKLEADGLVSRKPRYDRRGKRTSDRIRLCWSTSLPDTLSVSDDTTGQAGPVYQTNGSQLPDGESEESTRESTSNLPPTPKGLLICIYPPERAHGRWKEYYLSIGNLEAVQVAEKRGFFTERSKWPPVLPNTSPEKSFEQPPSCAIAPNIDQEGFPDKMAVG